MPTGCERGGGGEALTSSRALVSTLKPWLVSMVCRLSRLESMASKWSLSSVLARVEGAGQVELSAPPTRCLPAGAHTHQPERGCPWLHPTPLGPHHAPSMGPGDVCGRIAQAMPASPVTVRPSKAFGSTLGRAKMAGGGAQEGLSAQDGLGTVFQA